MLSQHGSLSLSLLADFLTERLTSGDSMYDLRELEPPLIPDLEPGIYSRYLAGAGHYASLSLMRWFGWLQPLEEGSRILLAWESNNLPLGDSLPEYKRDRWRTPVHL